MLDPKFILENQEIVKATIKHKNKNVDLDDWLKLYEQRLELEQQVQELRTQRNNVTDQIKSATTDERPKLIEQASEIKEKLAPVEEQMAKVEQDYLEILLAIPNITSPKMPVGKDEDENVVIRQWGEIPQFDFEPKDHIDLGKDLDLIDMETAAEVSGSRFYYLKNGAVRLQFAIIQFVLDTLGDQKIMEEIGASVNHPNPGTFQPVLPPVMMKQEVMKKMDRLDPIDERYQTSQDGLMLVGSAEHTLGPIHMGQLMDKEDLPIRYIGYSTAFRREAGSYGKDTKGILRVHQFDKLEMETFVPAEMGDAEQDFIVAIQEYLVQQLEIPHQVIQICTGDTGKPDYNQYDIECWIPTQSKYRETHTSDYMTDYQARRLNIRYKDGDERKFVHMNDATAFAITRILIAILENNQQADGTVKVPTVLQKYVGKELIE